MMLFRPQGWQISQFGGGGLLSNVPSMERRVCLTSPSHGTQTGVAFSATPIKPYEARVPFPKAIQIRPLPCPTPLIALRTTFQTLTGLQGASPCLLLDFISLLSTPTPQTQESAFGTSNRIDTSGSPQRLYNLQFPGQRSTAPGSISSCRS